MGTDSRGRVIVRDGSWGVVFVLAYVGAAIYFVSISSGTFWGVIIGLLQAIVWPAYVMERAQVCGCPRRFPQAAPETAGAACQYRRGREDKRARLAETGAGAETTGAECRNGRGRGRGRDSIRSP